MVLKMNTTIYYFTGTGNSLKIAQLLCDKLKECKLVSIASIWEEESIKSNSEKVGFVFPLYYAGLPKIVKDFINKMDFSNSEYFFTIVTSAGDITDLPLFQIEEILVKKSKKLNAGFFIRMPNNYIIGYDVDPKEKESELFEIADKKIEEIVKIIIRQVDSIRIDSNENKRNRKAKFNQEFHESVNQNDKNFYTDENCNSCGICEKICPVKNITLVDGKPEWQHKCQQCLACINYCPEKAIQFGSLTLKTQRYHHPEISFKVLMETVKK
jgi:ferredoxin